MNGIMQVSRERGLFVCSFAYSRHSVLSSRSLDKNRARQDGGFMLGATMLKQCSKCKRWKFKSEFHKNKTRKDGLTEMCKSCNKEHASGWYYANKKKAHETGRKWALAHIDKVKEIHRKWVENNPEKARELALKVTHKWRAKNPGKSREVSNNWKKANRERNLLINHNYRARKSGNGGTITAQEWQWLKEFYNFTCLKCGEKEPAIKLTLDHVKPLKLGGKNTIDNAQPLCGLCNSQKQARHIDYRPKKRLM